MSPNLTQPIQELDTIAHANLREKMKACSAAFLAERDGELSDMRKPTFWAAVQRLADAAHPSIPDSSALVAACQACKPIGSPGDFGYETAQGSSLRDLLVAIRDCHTVLQARDEADAVAVRKSATAAA